MYKNTLTATLILLISIPCVHAQGGLGTPVAPAKSSDATGTSAKVGDEGQLEVQERPQTLGQIGRAIITPLRSAAGQLMPPRAEPAPTQDDVARMAADGRYSPVEIFAAHVKADEMQARSRQAAVKYLASVDCSYFPEAESGLIASLRSDRIESVRYEAALALGNAPRLTEKMLEALNMTALGICLDGHPIEVSERVRQAAKQSLERCAARGLCLAPAQHTVLPSVDMLPPRPVVIQPIYYQAPMAVPTALPVSAQERHLAETISTSAKTPAAAAPSRPLLQFLMRFTSPREPADASQKHVDPRLRGLAPLGNDGSLVIPNSAK